ncbi:MAG TPA: NAD(P)/FAD-dependent oxidoreductase [Pseudonocardiaceae bacterium]|jgi:cation diffusion facilitator CzcD-associated flavoprotein CzcO|nr:NAD(P)/FAD-dependent oxidoreductase [Pseudonocardiaceae bacterium]
MSVEHVDVAIVGAGLSGVGAACHLMRDCPGKTFAILEARDVVGGTWDLFRYPGVRSDSDMFTLGYSFRPWTGAKAIADGPSILSYIRSTAAEFGVEQRVRYGHRVIGADWDSESARWTVRVRRDGESEPTVLTCSFLYACTGYYRYDEGYLPPFPGIEEFAGPVVHPQHWPADLDYADKRVVVVGSGATAVTLVPALARTAAHVTMVQRSPSYVIALPATDVLADRLRRWLPDRLAYPLLRWKNALLALTSFQLSRRRPHRVKAFLRNAAVKQLPAGYDVDTHFSPRYNPWDQRLCVVPDGDLFAAIRSGRAEIATDHIEAFTEHGIRLKTGGELPADIVVTATGLNLLAIGGIELTVDGADVKPGESMVYKGMMLSGVPNFAWTIGYTNASWTLKADLVATYVCRLLRHMDATARSTVTPIPTMTPGTDPIIDLAAGYVLRSADLLPKQGAAAPWRLHQNYVRDVRLLRHGRIDDDVVFG